MTRMLRVFVVSCLIGTVSTSLLWMLVPAIGDFPNWTLGQLAGFGLRTMALLGVATFLGLMLALFIESLLFSIGIGRGFWRKGALYVIAGFATMFIAAVPAIFELSDLDIVDVDPKVALGAGVFAALCFDVK